MINQLSISCNCYDFKEMDLSVHLVNGAISIIIIKCENCERHVYPTSKSIDSSTWDLKCSCGFIAYKHPLREERIEQIKNLLD